MSEKLTPQQKMAVENRGGNLLVSAAAGSGKTKVLVDRLMSYLTDSVNPVNIDDFLIITYTKAAAAELRSKISDKLSAYIAQHPENRHMQQQIRRLHMAKISTVHSFCADILREYAYKLDISADFRIAEENECQEMMYHCLQELLDEAYRTSIDNASFRCFIDTQGLGRDDRQIPEIILQLHSSALCHLNPDNWYDWCLSAAKVDGLTDASETIWGSYLINDLKEYLQMQIEALENCITAASAVSGMEKPVALLSATVADLRSLYGCNTWNHIATHPEISYGTLTFKKDVKGTQLAEQIKAIRKNCKDGLAKKLRSFSDTSEIVLQHLQTAAIAAEGLIDLAKTFGERYTKIKRNRRVLDFSDVEQKTLDLLFGKSRNNLTVVAEEVGSRFCEIMVDEYQDSNEVQDAIFSALTKKRHNCFMVGDVKQSIYQFRLADPDIFLKKYDTFAPAETAQRGEGRKIILSSNFRSSAGVISAVNDIFTACMSRKVGGLEYGEEEMLREGIPHIPIGEREVSLYAIDVKEDTYQEESAFVAQKIQSLLSGNHLIREGDSLRPITADDIVILLRSPGSVGEEFRYALETIGISCTMGSDLNLLETEEIQTLHSILQTIANPLQDIPLIASLASPLFGFSADDLAKIRDSNRHAVFYKALEEKHSDKTDTFINLLTELRYDARFLTVTELIQQIFLKTNMLSIYGAMECGERKLENLQSFYQIASDYESNGYKDLSHFLDQLSAMEETGLRIAGSVPTNAVRIMSIHKSKGLEFPVVFLCGLSRSFNTSDIQKQVLCHKKLGLGLTSTNTEQRVRFPTIAKRAIAAKISEDTISEELRVLYVALTRARDRLIMTYAGSKLADRIKDIAHRLDYSPRQLLMSHVSCPGTWVLAAALRRIEAGELFHIGDRPDCVFISEHPWDIHVVNVEPLITTGETHDTTVREISSEIIERIHTGLNFKYPYSEAVQIPSKLTATQLKGRIKDHEAAEFTADTQKHAFDFRSPLKQGHKNRGTEYGNALHSIMQYLNFDCCHCVEAIQDDIVRMVSAGLITQEQAEIIDVVTIFNFFQTELGKKLCSSTQILREFKFSILVNADTYYSGIHNDQILLQGVVDCALIEDCGITIIDFKSDFITENNLQEKIHQYSEQIKTYANALSRIYQKPIIAAYLYFFSSGQLISVQ